MLLCPPGRNIRSLGSYSEELFEATRNLTLTGYAEFTNHSNYEQDQVNLQYSLFITRTLFEGNRIIQQIHGNLDALHDDEKVDDKQVTERFFGLAGREVSSYCGDKSAFLGPYHGYGDPVGVTSGQLENTLSNNGNSCGALSCTVSLLRKNLRPYSLFWA